MLLLPKSFRQVTLLSNTLFKMHKVPYSSKFVAIDIDELKWRNLNTSLSQLNCRHTLVQGQCFNWYRLEDSHIDTWVGVVAGQPLAFRQTNDSASYASLLSCSVPKQNENVITNETSVLSELELDTFVRSYLQLDTDLEELYATWAKGCPRMKQVTNALPGVRVLRQPPWECLVSFICSSNNNIKRITSLLDKLKRAYGSYICSVVPGLGQGKYNVVIVDAPPVILPNLQSNPSESGDLSDDEKEASLGTPSRKRPTAASPMSSPAQTITTPGENNNKGASTTVHLFSFPTPSALAAACESGLRSLGTGYRAKYLYGSAIRCEALGGLPWLLSLRAPNLATNFGLTPVIQQMQDLPQAKQKKKQQSEISAHQPLHRLYVREQLQQLPGVGPKVADCVAVFSLDQSDTIPVDVHVFDIAARDYDPTLLEPSKASPTGQLPSLTPRIYERVGNLFRDRFGSHAGWAHSVLFAAELPPFKFALPKALQEEMTDFDQQQRAAKKQRANDKKLSKVSEDGIDVSTI